MGAPRFSFLIYLAIGTVLIIPSVLCACYHPDGTRDMDEVWQPCSEFGGSMCCATNRTNAARGDLSNGTTSDVCLPNGLCINEGLDNGKLYQSYWRDYCTDSNWRDGNCLRVCLDRPVGQTNGNTVMVPCDGTSTSKKWCCGPSRDCCEQDDHPLAVTLSATFKAGLASTSASLPASSSTAISSTTSMSIESTLTTQTHVPQPESQTASKSNLTAGVKAGIGVGVVVGTLMLLGLGFFIYKSLEWKRKLEAAQSTDFPNFKYATEKYVHHELGDAVVLHELCGVKAAHQLP